MGLSPFPAAKRIVVTPFPANCQLFPDLGLQMLWTQGEALVSCTRKKWHWEYVGVCSAGAVVTALIELSLWGELRWLGLNRSAPVSELSVKYIVACAGRKQFLHNAGMGLLERWGSSTLLLSDLSTGSALQPQFNSCSFQLEAGQSPVVSTQLPASGYPVQCVPQQV